MSAQVFSRDIAQGKVKKLHRMKQPLTLNIKLQTVHRNPVVRAMAQRATSSAAGKHIRSHGAQRRADKVALHKLVRQQEV